jgi:hypothetical protein
MGPELEGRAGIGASFSAMNRPNAAARIDLAEAVSDGSEAINRKR